MHASFTSMISAAVFGVLYISSTAVAAPADLSVLEARAENPLAKCWAKGSAGTDAGTTIPEYCRSANSPTFDSYKTLLTYTDVMTYPSHVSKGLWHCCATCYNNPTCVSWIFDDYCNCSHYLNQKCLTGGAKFEFQDKTAGNVTNVFHKGNVNKCKPLTNL